MDLQQITNHLTDNLDCLQFAEPVTHVYNPLKYARPPHDVYLQRFGSSPKEVVLLGMNPGPFGMVQTGVPFGTVSYVRDWLGIEAPVGKPDREHPKRPVLGFACRREEVSGQRLWGWAAAQFDSAERFFERFFVINYCPLALMEHSGKNRTPDKLALQERRAVFAACDAALRQMIAILRPQHVIGIGGFAQARATAALQGLHVKIGQVLHPSPASPLANRGWAAQASAQLQHAGIALA